MTANQTLAPAAKIFVLGGTGFLGRAFGERFMQAEGGAVGRLVVPTRHIGHGTGLLHLPGIELIEADVHDPAVLARLDDGADAVVNLVAILHGSDDEFRHVHVELPRKLAAACRSAGVRRVVHVSALGAAADAPSMYLRTKAAGEQVLLDAGLDLTILRPSVMFGAGDKLMTTFARLQELLPLVPLAGSDARFQPVWVDDVANAIVRCIERPETAGRIYELAGPEVVTLSELMRRAGRWTGHERPQVALGDGLARLQAALLEALPGVPMMSADNLDSMKVPNVASGKLPGLADLGIEATPMEAVMPAALVDAGPTRFDGWRAGSGGG